MAGPIDYIPRIRAKYSALGHGVYEWVRGEDAPKWQPLSRPLSECRLALIASGGVYLTGQVAFHHRDDTSFREIPTTCATRDLRATHFAYDLEPARADPNVVFPIDTLRGLRDEGVIGELAATAYTFMGGIYSAERVRNRLSPLLVERLVAQSVDALLLVPV